MTLKRLLLALLATLLSASYTYHPIYAQDSCRITDIRYWQSPEEAQIVIDLSAPPKVTQVNSLRDGTYFFDIEICSFKPCKQSFPLKSVFIEALTVQERENGMTRLYYRVGPGVVQRTFVLPKSTEKSDRIVIFLSEPPSVVMARREEELKQISKLKSENIKIIVLDPGHGGEDPGTRNNGIIEKNYVLAMGKLIKSYFDKDPRYRAILTRSGDYIIPLEGRRRISEHLGADAFVSLHANYNRKKAIRGSEVYYESPRGAVGEAERLVADKENQQDYIGGVSTDITPEVVIKKNIVEMQANAMFMSRQLAEKVDAQLWNSGSGMPSRGVKRAGFKVLHSLTMPSVLVEFGYTSNLQDVQILLDYNSRMKMAYAVYRGVCDFLENDVISGKDEAYLEYVAQVEQAKIARAKKKLTKKSSKLTKYKVRRGDSLSSVAQKFKISLKALANANNFKSNRMLKIGETIKIPGK